MTNVINSLTELYEAGYSYRSLKGAFNNRPPQPRYKSTWSVSQVVTWLDQQKKSQIPLQTLAMKAVTLCALTQPSRLAELANLSVHSLVFSLEGVSAFSLTSPKQCQPGKAIKKYFLPRFEENSNICPVATPRL